MIARYEDLTPEALAPLGFDDPAQACRLLQDMAGQGVPDPQFESLLRALLAALGDSADPDRALANLRRWADAVGSRATAYAQLADHPTALRMLLVVMAASQFFADLLIHNPEYLEVLTNPAIRDRSRPPGSLWNDLSRRVAIARTPGARRDALRRFKAPEILRIGVRDLLGYTGMAATAAEISAFADACVRMALQICSEERPGPEFPFAVIAMGKMGGRELNYASDIDLIFVHGDEAPATEAIKLAESLRDTLARATDAGFVFRVDLRLRPEGRFGPISRSLGSCRAYYESWAEPWERQALLKARFAAGDPGLGAAFEGMAQAFVYRSRVEEAFVESIRGNKRRLEQKVAGADEADVNVKEGIGGIRDIEFAVQLMQLVTGGTHPAVRTGNTLEALERLAAEGLLTAEERDVFVQSYVFLRTVEHRLQIMDELAVRTLPRAPNALRKFGRGLGYADGKDFLAEYHRHTTRVHALFRRLFYGEGNSPDEPAGERIAGWVLAPDDPAARQQLHDALLERGFADPEAALRLLRRAAAGSEYGETTPEARAALAAVAGPLLDAAGATPDPDSALRGIEGLAQALPSPAALYRTLGENARLLPRLCRLASESPFLWQTLLQHLEFFDALADEEALDSPPRRAPAADAHALASSALRERLRIGARDIWGLASLPQTLADTTRLGELLLREGLEIARRETGAAGRFAMIGLGKLGGAEMGYGSDLDVLYVAEAGALDLATRLAQRLQHLLQDDLVRFGFRCALDARLRPEGRKGVLVLDLDSYRAYYTHSAATWERQALLKARLVAGDETLGEQFGRLAEETVYQTALSTRQLDEIRAMKRRIETERLKQAHDLKLMPGGLTDIEWTTQILQLQHGVRNARVRRPGTLAALRALRDEARITQADWEVLDHAYTRLMQLRNHLFLRTGVAADAPAVLPDDLPAQTAAVRAVCRRLFYGEP